MWRSFCCSNGSHGKASMTNNFCSSDFPPSAKYAFIFHESLLRSQSWLGKTSCEARTKAFISLSHIKMFYVSGPNLSLLFDTTFPGVHLCPDCAPLSVRIRLSEPQWSWEDQTEKRELVGRAWSEALMPPAPSCPVTIWTRCKGGAHNEKADSQWLLELPSPILTYSLWNSYVHTLEPEPLPHADSLLCLYEVCKGFLDSVSRCTSCWECAGWFRYVSCQTLPVSISQSSTGRA